MDEGSLEEYQEEKEAKYDYKLVYSISESTLKSVLFHISLKRYHLIVFKYNLQPFKINNKDLNVDTNIIN